MTNAELIDLIMGRLGRRKSPDLRAIVVQEANVKKAEYEKKPTLPWWMENTSALAGSFTIGNPALALPSTFIREVEDASAELIDPDDGLSVFLRKKPFETIQRQIQLDPGEPQIYALFGGNVYVAVPPSKAYTIKLPHFARGVDLVDDGSPTVGWWLEVPQLMIAATVTCVAADHLKDFETSDRYASRETALRKDLWQAIEARLNTNLDMQIGEDEEFN